MRLWFPLRPASCPALSCCACESRSVRNERAIGPMLMLMLVLMLMPVVMVLLQGFARGRRNGGIASQD